MFNKAVFQIAFSVPKRRSITAFTVILVIAGCSQCTHSSPLKHAEHKVTLPHQTDVSIVLIAPSISVNSNGLKTDRGSCSRCLTEFAAWRGNASELYLRGDEFEPQPGQHLSSLRNAGIVPQIRPWFLPSKSFPIILLPHHPIIRLNIVRFAGSALNKP